MYPERIDRAILLPRNGCKGDAQRIVEYEFFIAMHDHGVANAFCRRAVDGRPGLDDNPPVCR